MLDPSILHTQDFVGLRYVVLPVVVVPFVVLCLVCVSLICYGMIRVALQCLRCVLRRGTLGLDGLLSRTLSVMILFAILALSVNYNIYLIHQAKYQYRKTDCILHNVTAYQQAGLHRYSATVTFN
jgi:hypothetical protein